MNPVDACGPDFVAQMGVAMWLLGGGFWMLVGVWLKTAWDDNRRNRARASTHPLGRGE